MHTMKAKFTAKELHNVKPGYDKKEVVASFNAVVCKDGEIHNPVSATCYMGRSLNSSTVYCNVWIHGKVKDDWLSLSGSGQAGGYGYHRVSAAVGMALRSAGVELYGTPYTNGEEKKVNMNKKCSIHGVGDSAVEAAFKAICRAMGYRGKVKIIR